jgi:hypothetical protein
MKSSHCLSAFHDNSEESDLGEDGESHFVLFKRLCLACNRFILSLHERFLRFRAG